MHPISCIHSHAADDNLTSRASSVHSLVDHLHVCNEEVDEHDEVLIVGISPTDQSHLSVVVVNDVVQVEPK